MFQILIHFFSWGKLSFYPDMNLQRLESESEVEKSEKYERDPLESRSKESNESIAIKCLEREVDSLDKR